MNLMIFNSAAMGFSFADLTNEAQSIPYQLRKCTSLLSYPSLVNLLFIAALKSSADSHSRIDLSTFFGLVNTNNTIGGSKKIAGYNTEKWWAQGSVNYI